MSWQDDYEIARSMRASSDRLFARGEHQYASEGVWGALRYMSRALAERYGKVEGKSLEKGYIPGRPNEPENVADRLSRRGATHDLHLHFYNSHLDDATRADKRRLAAALLDEAAGALEAG